jgi:hypothetical protein
MPTHAQRQECVPAPWSDPQFAKGPLFFVSARLIAELLGTAWLAADVDAALAGAAPAASAIPYEDIYVGMALARVARGEGLALVESGLGLGRPSPTYSDGYGMQLAPSTLYWHMRTNVPHRLAFAHHWASVQGHHCHLPSGTGAPPAVICKRASRSRTHSCAGGLWTRCYLAGMYAYRAANCSTQLTELKRRAEAWRRARAASRCDAASDA